MNAVNSVVGGTIHYTGGGYDEWTVIAPDGRHWKAVSDGSLGSRSTSAEVVTPILKWDDMDTLQMRLIIKSERGGECRLVGPGIPGGENGLHLRLTAGEERNIIPAT